MLCKKLKEQMKKADAQRIKAKTLVLERELEMAASSREERAKAHQLYELYRLLGKEKWDPDFLANTAKFWFTIDGKEDIDLIHKIAYTMGFEHQSTTVGDYDVASEFKLKGYEVSFNFSFSDESKCKRIKIGSRTVEENVYEVQYDNGMDKKLKVEDLSTGEEEDDA